MSLVRRVSGCSTLPENRDVAPVNPHVANSFGILKISARRWRPFEKLSQKLNRF